MTPEETRAFEAVRDAWAAFTVREDKVEARIQRALKLGHDLHAKEETEVSRQVFGSACNLTSEYALVEDDAAAAKEWWDKADDLGFHWEAACTQASLAFSRRDWDIVARLIASLPILKPGTQLHPFWHIARPNMQAIEAALAMNQKSHAREMLRALLGDSRTLPWLEDRANTLNSAWLLRPSGKGLKIGHPVTPPAWSLEALN